MRKALLFGSFVLALLVSFQLAMSDPAAAQGKKKAGAAGSIEIREGKDGKFRFFVLDGDGKTLAFSASGAASAKDSQAALDQVKDIISTAKVTTVPKKGGKKAADKDNE